jgi:hypothetical protein
VLIDTRRALLLCAYIAACIAAFSLGLTGPFLVDDWTNLPVTIPVDGRLDALWDASLANESGLLRRPLANLSFALNYLASGPSALHFKAVNLALHIGVGFVLFFLAKTLASTRLDDLDAEACGWATMFVWALHPAHAGVVLYAVQRMTILSALFVLIAAALYAHWRLQGAFRAGMSSLARLAILAGLGLLGLLCKENAALLPLLLGCIELYIRATRERHRPYTRGEAAVIGLGILLPITVMLASVWVYWDWIAAQYAGRPFSPSERLATQVHALYGYLQQGLIPLPSSFAFLYDAYPIHRWSDPSTLLTTAFSVGLLALLIRQRRRWPGLYFGVLWFVCAHAMESSILALELFWEHRNYLPLAGLAAGAVIDARHALSSAGEIGRKRVAQATLGLIGLSLISLSATRSGEFASSASLAARVTAAYPTSVRGHLLALDSHLQDAQGVDISWVSDQLALLARIESEPLRTDFLGFLLSCSGTRFEPQIAASLENALTTEFNQHLLGYATRIGNAAASKQCQGLDAEATTLIDSLLSNPHYAAPIPQSELLLVKANLALANSNHALRVRLLAEVGRLDPTNPKPGILLVQHYLRQGDAAGAASALFELRSNQPRFGRPIGSIIRVLESQIDVRAGS